MVQKTKTPVKATTTVATMGQKPKTPKKTPNKTPKKAAETTPQPQQKLKTPKAKTPKVQTPKVQTPKVQTPKVQTPKVKTPKAKTPKAKTPKSAQPVKRKMLEEEIDEQLSDEDFEALIQGVSKTEKSKLEKGTKTPQKKDEDESDDEDVDMTDDEDDVDDDSEDEMDDEDEESEEEPAAPPAKKKKQADKKSKINGTSKNTSKVDSSALKQDTKVADERDKKTLFIKPLDSQVKEDEIKALSKEIVDVRIRVGKRGNRKERGVAFVEFKSEKAADRHHKLLLNKKVGGVTIAIVDYVGEKSNNKDFIKKTDPAEFDPLKLYICGFGRDTKQEDLEKLFPESEFTVPMKKKTKIPLGFAFAAYTSENLAKKAHDACQGKSFGGKTLTVLFAKKATAKPLKRKAEETKEEPKLKKTKVEKQKPKQEVEEVEDEDSEDDDIDGDDDDSDDVDDDKEEGDDSDDEEEDGDDDEESD